MQYSKYTGVHRGPFRQTYDGNLADRDFASEEQDVRPSSTLSVQRIVYLIYSVIAGLLLLRFVFALFGANPLNHVAHFVYTITQPLVSPFQSLFGDGTLVYKNNRLEFDALIAIVVYRLLAWVIVRMIGVDRAPRDGVL